MNTTRAWDAAEYLKTDNDMALYLQAVMDECNGDSKAVVSALGDIARAKGMQALAQQANLSRTSLYKALSPSGNPEFSTILKIFQGLGLRLAVNTNSLPA
jgi:probable addiction module antidote protein